MGAELSIWRAFRTSPKRSAAITADSKRALSVFGLAGSGATNGFFDRATASFHRDSRSVFHFSSLAFTRPTMLSFLRMRLPPRIGVHKMHLGNMKKSAQLPNCPLKVASSKIRPQSVANAERWLFGTRLMRGVSIRQISINETEKARSAFSSTARATGSPLRGSRVASNDPDGGRHPP